MAHNIWRADTESEDITYKEYNLDKITSGEFERINIIKEPLLFFLCLLDSIEPVKRFPNDPPKEIWKNVSIELKENSIVISSFENLEGKYGFQDWKNTIKDMPKWLDLNVEPSQLDDGVNTITIIPNKEEPPCQTT
jgi:hypothetical protein